MKPVFVESILQMFVLNYIFLKIFLIFLLIIYFIYKAIVKIF